MNLEKYILKFIDILNLDRRVISRDNGEKYLTRYYIFRKPLKWMPSVYIHCFHNGDVDQELHSHPWDRSISFILNGSYLEERRSKSDAITTKIFSPGNINYIKGTDFHRVDLMGEKVWTLFISGAKVKDWHFWNIDTRELTQWEEFINRKKRHDSNIAA
jgi:hypothetical protein